MALHAQASAWRGTWAGEDGQEDGGENDEEEDLFGIEPSRGDEAETCAQLAR